MRAPFLQSRFAAAALALACAGALPPARAQAPEPPPIDREAAQTGRVNAALKKAGEFLVAVQHPVTGAIHDEKRNVNTLTALAVLALAGLGHQPGDPTPEGKAMKRALDFVLLSANQDENGYFGKADDSRMYGHGIITLMLAEMLGMGADEQQDALMRERCRKGVALILRSQQAPKTPGNEGGWRYLPDSPDSDLSVTCWHALALRSARNAGLEVPKEAIDQAIAYIKRLYDPAGNVPGQAGFGYMAPARETSTTAEGLLALQICGDYDGVEVKGAGERLLRTGFSRSERWLYYTAYYYAQGMYQRGGGYIAASRETTRNVLLPLQAADGSWDAVQGAEAVAGRIYATSLSILALSVKNHYLPIYQR